MARSPSERPLTPAMERALRLLYECRRERGSMSGTTAWEIGVYGSTLSALEHRGLAWKSGVECVARPHQKVALWCDHHRPEEPRYSELAMLPREVALDLLRRLADAHGAKVVDTLQVLSPVDLIDAVSRAQKEAAEVSIAACEAIRDGVISDAEALLIAQESEEAGRAHFAIAEAMRSRLAVQ